MNFEDDKFDIGVRCKIRSRSSSLQLGRVAFIGPVHYAKGHFVGVVLERKVSDRRFRYLMFFLFILNTTTGNGKEQWDDQGKGIFSM